MRARVGLVVLLAVGALVVASCYTPPTGSGGTTTTTVPLANVVEIDAGTTHTCALIDDGTVRCWGLGSNGQLGNGDTESSAIPVQVSGIDDAVAISAGDQITCAIVTDGAVKCWGNGQGVGSQPFGSYPTPQDLDGLTGATQISVGSRHGCVIVGGGVECWGANVFGELGVPGGGIRLTPVAVPGLSGVTEVEAGGYHVCALAAGAVKCWGYNSVGQVGDGTTTDRDTPTDVAVTGVTQLTGGQYFTCGVVGTGAKCWGGAAFEPNHGTLGNGTDSNSTVPVDVTGLSSATALGSNSGSGRHTCAIEAGGSLSCWGDNAHWQFGNGSVSHTDSNVAVAAASGLTGIAQVTAGSDHTCALLSAGGVRCWGNSSSGQAGSFDFEESTPTPIVGLA